MWLQWQFPLWILLKRHLYPFSYSYIQWNIFSLQRPKPYERYFEFAFGSWSFKHGAYSTKQFTYGKYNELNLIIFLIFLRLLNLRLPNERGGGESGLILNMSYAYENIAWWFLLTRVIAINFSLQLNLYTIIKSKALMPMREDVIPMSCRRQHKLLKLNYFHQTKKEDNRGRIAELNVIESLNELQSLWSKQLFL